MAANRAVPRLPLGTIQMLWPLGEIGAISPYTREQAFAAYREPTVWPNGGGPRDSPTPSTNSISRKAGGGTSPCTAPMVQKRLDLPTP